MLARSLLPTLSLSAKIAALSLGLVVATTIALAWMSLRWQSAWQEQALVASGRSVARMLAKNVEFGVFTEDAATLADASSGMDADPNVSYVAIHARDGRLLYFRQAIDRELVGPPGILEGQEATERVRDVAAGDGSGEEFLEITVPIRTAPTVVEDAEPPKTIGWVRLGIPRSVLQQSAREVLLTLAPAVAVLLAIAAFVALVLSRSLMVPVRELVAATERVVRGDLRREVRVPADVDLANLALSFNEMLRRLEAKQIEVEAQHATLESRVEERTVSLRNAVAEAKDLALRAEEASRTKSSFLARMSHELRTPLNAILGYSEMLLDGFEDSEPDEVRRDLDAIRRAGQHLLGLITDVLDLSRIEAGSVPVQISRFELRPLLDEALALVRPMARARGNELVFTADSELGRLESDDTRVRQILINLLSNACKFTRSGVVTVRVTAGDDRVAIEVEDTGIGIPTAMLDRIFDPFVQVDGSYTREADGTGLGLAISARFTEMLGGKLTVRSELGVGSTFELSLPRHLPTANSETLAAADPRFSRPGDTRTHGDPPAP